MTKVLKKDAISFHAHPVLEALRSIQTGVLTLTLPEGQELLYSGSKPGLQAEMHLHDWRALDDIADHGDIGLGEGYMRDLWDTNDLKSLMRLFADNIETIESYIDGSPFYRMLHSLKNKCRPNTHTGSKNNIHSHYDLGNDFYKLWLDETLTYSGALFNGDAGKSLESAQKAKYQRILSHLSPSPTDHILEIGCGWGGFMAEAAKKGHRVTGVTISSAQAELAQIRLAEAGLDHLAKLRLQDYREIPERHDHIVSIGMFEHVGEKFWPEYMQTIYKLLKPSGKAMIQTIVKRDDLFKRYRSSSDFLREHIFPGGMLPSPASFKANAIEAGLQIKDIFFFGGDYAITLEKWLEKFDNKIQAVRDMGHNEEFIRKWRFYLTSCSAMFRTGRINLMQIELCHA